MRGFDGIGLHGSTKSLSAYQGGIGTTLNTRSYATTALTGAGAGIGSGLAGKPNTFDNI